MRANPGFPLVLDVKEWPVLVIGGDEEAADKSQRLLESGAKVMVISPTLNDTLRQLAASGKVIHRGRHFRDADLDTGSPVRVAISTSGGAPALSGFMKEDLEHILDAEFVDFVEWLGQLREQAKLNEPDAEKRRALLRAALDGFRFRGKVQYPAVWVEERAKLVAGQSRPA